MGSTIVYGQGNLLFDRKNDEHWHSALVVLATFSDRLSVQYLPVVHEGGRALLAEGGEAAAILEGFHARSREILSPASSKRRLPGGRSRRSSAGCSRSPGNDRLLTKIDRRLGGRFTRRMFTERRLIDSVNLIECEALREQLLAGLKTRLKT